MFLIGVHTWGSGFGINNSDLDLRLRPEDLPTPLVRILQKSLVCTKHTHTLLLHKHPSVLRDYGNMLCMEDLEQRLFDAVCETGVSSPERKAWVK